jgi:hypothetical protein
MITGPTVAVVCRSCRSRTDVPIDQAASPTAPTAHPQAAGYDLIAALHADDLDAAAAALPATTSLHVATAAVVLATAPSPADLQTLLQRLALAAEIDDIDIGAAS